ERRLKAKAASVTRAPAAAKARRSNRLRVSIKINWLHDIDLKPDWAQLPHSYHHVAKSSFSGVQVNTWTLHCGRVVMRVAGISSTGRRDLLPMKSRPRCAATFGGAAH